MGGEERKRGGDSRPSDVRRARIRLTKRMKRAGDESKLEVRVVGESMMIVSGELTVSETDRSYQDETEVGSKG